jgi:catechol 2,3-dioxygenase
VAQLGHVEILSPKPAETVEFFTELLGMRQSRQVGQSVYLRAYEDSYDYTLKVTEARRPGLGHAAWRTASEKALSRRAKALERAGVGTGWTEDQGHGPAYQFRTPDGHRMELFWEVDYHRPPDKRRTGLLNRPERRPNRGVPVRRIDHINLLSAHPDEDTELLCRELGFNLRETIVTDDGSTLLGTWMAVTNLSHDIAIMRESVAAQGRFHHVAYWYSSPQHLYDVADLFKDAGVFIESGPGKHGISQAMFMYVYEPGGNRIELFGDAGILVFDPSYQTVVWKQSEVPGRGDVWIPLAAQSPVARHARRSIAAAAAHRAL